MGAVRQHSSHPIVSSTSKQTARDWLLQARAPSGRAFPLKYDELTLESNANEELALESDDSDEHNRSDGWATLYMRALRASKALQLEWSEAFARVYPSEREREETRRSVAHLPPNESVTRAYIGITITLAKGQ